MEDKDELKEISKTKMKKDSRSILRERAFRMYFSDEFEKISKEKMEYFLENNGVKKHKEIEYLSKHIYLKHNKEKELKEIIEKYLKEDWEYSRITKTSIALLKLSIIEIQDFKIPFKVVINEVLNLAKEYENEKTSNFINGILSSYIKDNVEVVEQEQK